MDLRMKYCMPHEGDTEDEQKRHAKWATAPFELGLNSGPFHYMIRSSGYGELYDGIPWKVMFGAAVDKDRSGFDRSALVCRYRNGVLIHNWLEEGRDREAVKFSRTAPISQYGHLYRTTYGTTIGKKYVCNEQTPAMRQISEFAKNAFPGHQPELDVDRIRCCQKKPEACIDREKLDACFAAEAHDKRVQKLAPPSISSAR